VPIPSKLNIGAAGCDRSNAREPQRAPSRRFCATSLSGSGGPPFHRNAASNAAGSAPGRCRLWDWLGDHVA
jgi:hypothetical protein